MAKTVVGLYDDITDAQRTVEALIQNGFRRDDISLVANDASGEMKRYVGDDTKGEDMGSGAAAGAGVGAVVGGLGGLLVGLGVLAIPGIGPVLAAGPLVSALAGAGVGALAGGLIGALLELGIPEDKAKNYAEGVRRGGTLVVVKTSDDQANTAVDIMNRFNPVDFERRATQWEGYTGQSLDQDAAPYTPQEIEMERSRYDRDIRDRDEDTLEVVEEELRVGKRPVETGGVRIHTYVTEESVSETVNLRQEHVDVERRRVDRPATEADLNAFEEGTFEVTETGEEPVVEKRARVVEEVEVHKDIEEHPEEIRETLRRKNVDVEEIRNQGRMDMSGYDEYEPFFRSHYESSLSTSGYSYDDYQPAYRYGYDLASSDRYRGRSWNEIEREARRDWEQRHRGSAWEEFKDAVHQGWATVTGRD